MANEIPKFSPTTPEKYPMMRNVVGQAKEFISEISENMDNAGIYYSLGIAPDKTFMINSEPGMGKTFGIKALNNERNKDFQKKILKRLSNIIDPKTKEVNIPVVTVKLNDLNMLLMEYDIGKYGTAYINMGSRIAQAFFDEVFKYSTYGVPILVSVDECESLFKSRKSQENSHSEDKKVLNTLMKNLQRAHDSENVYTIMMTNLLEDIDDASIRAGRIDRRIKLNSPSKLERKLAYENAIKTVNEKAGYQVARNINYNNLSELSEGFNYADIYQSIDGALRTKAKQLIKSKEPGIIRAGYVKGSSVEKAVQNHKKEFKEKIKKRKRIGFI